MFYYYSFLAIAAISLVIILSIMFAMRRNVLKTRLHNLRERIGNDSKHFPISLNALKDEILMAENELAAKQV